MSDSAPVKRRSVLAGSNCSLASTSLRGWEGAAARVLEFAILTAARSGEVRGARWEQVDIDTRLWTVPSERMKAGKEHRVPLADAAMALLRALPQQRGLLFPGQKDEPLSDMSLTAVLRRMRRTNITVHCFRSTFRDWCAEAAGNTFTREVCVFVSILSWGKRNGLGVSGE